MGDNMKEQDYKKLNRYLNEFFLYLEPSDSFFLEIIVNVIVLNNKFFNSIKDYDLENKSNRNHLTFDEVYLITREIIESINPNYLKDYDNLIEKGILNFDYSNYQSDDEDVCGNYKADYIDLIRKKYNLTKMEINSTNNDKKNYTITKSSEFIHDNDIHNEINIIREFNYTDVIQLVHEFIHYVTGKTSNKSLNRYLLAEFFFFFFETYAKDYLIKKGISKDEIYYKDRLRFLYQDAEEFYEYESPLVAYSYFGDVSDKSYELLNEYVICNLNKDVFDYECYNLLDYFESIDLMHQDSNQLKQCRSDLRQEYTEFFSDHFKYLWGTLLTFYARSYCNLEDIVKMNDEILTYDGNIIKCLEKMGIMIYEPDFCDKISKSIDEFICEYEIKKR